MELKDLILNFVQVTEKAAIESYYFNGKEDRHGADKAATEAMRESLGKMSISGRVVIGEGERDEAPMLFFGEELGTGGMKVDIAVDPLEGTNLCAQNLPGAICVMALSERGGLTSAPDTYMNKIVVSKDVKEEVSLFNTPKQNLEIIAKSLNIPKSEVNIIVMDRERHIDLIADLREEGAKVHLISDGDINAGIQAALPLTKIHALMGIGAAPEGVITAAAVRILGGQMKGMFMPHTEGSKAKALSLGINLEKEYTEKELASGKNLLVVATGVTSGDLLRGVTIKEDEVHTESIYMSLENSEVVKMQKIYLENN